MGTSDVSSTLQYQIMNTIMKCMASENSVLSGADSSDNQSSAFDSVLQSIISAASESGSKNGTSSDALSSSLLSLLGSSSDSSSYLSMLNGGSDASDYSSLLGLSGNTGTSDYSSILSSQSSIGSDSIDNYYGASGLSSANSKINVSNSAIEKAVDTASKKYGVDKNLILSVIQQESSFNQYSTSGAGAMGLMQLMPGTAKELGVANAYDINQNVDGGTKYLKSLLSTFGDYKKAIAAYNAGPGAVQRSNGDISKLPNETKDYVAKVSKYYTNGI